MRAIYWFFFCLVLLIKPGFTQILPPSSEDSSVVYFLRGSMNENFNPSLLYSDNFSLRYDGVNTNTIIFFIYDNNKLIGKLDTISYFRYECKPGYHLFWSRHPGNKFFSPQDPNNDFVEAELAAGKVYFINVSAEVIKRSPDLRPIYPDNKFWVDGILHFISSQPAEEITDRDIKRYQIRWRKKIEKELYRYEEDKLKGRYRSKMTKDMYYRSP